MNMVKRTISNRKTRAFMTSFAVIAIIAAIGYALGSFGAEWARENRFQKERQEKTASAMARMESFVRVGNRLPDHEFYDMEGISVRLSDIVGPWTIIAYMKNQCGSCRLELENLKKVTAQCGNQSYVILIYDSDPEQMLAIQKEYDLTCPVLYDMEGTYKEELGIFVYPFNLIVDDSLEIRDLIAGYVRSDEFVEINRLNLDYQR